LSQGIFWMVIPSLMFFVMLPVLLRRNIDFWLSLGISLTITIIAYFIMMFILRRMGILI
jgi:predicted permease